MTSNPPPADGSSDSPPNPAFRKVALPTGALLVAAALAAVVAGLGWTAVAFALGQRGAPLTTGLAAAGVVLSAATISILLLRPWRPKALIRWPSVWVAASFVRLLITLGGTFLLYSAAPYHSRSLWIAAVVAYVAVMVGETRMYASSMRRLAPPPPLPENPPVQPPPSEDPSMRGSVSE